MSFPFVNLRPLNSGGNGDLFIAQRKGTGEPVVIKFLREWQSADARRAFAREVGVLRRKLHGLVPLLFADLNAKRPYYAMPYLSRGPLTQYAGRLADGELHAVAVALANTLANLHSAFEAHGDIKPDNILVTQDGGLQLADPLGNGSILTIVFSQNRGGTPGYWAPEIPLGGPISRPGDMYSYGATLHHLVTGERPLDGQRLDQSSQSYGRSPKVREIIAACCQVNSQARPTIQEVLQILQGKSWTDIKEDRRKRTEAVGGVLMSAGLLALVLAMMSGRKRG